MGHAPIASKDERNQRGANRVLKEELGTQIDRISTRKFDISSVSNICP